MAGDPDRPGQERDVGGVERAVARPVDRLLPALHRAGRLVAPVAIDLHALRREAHRLEVALQLEDVGAVGHARAQRPPQRPVAVEQPRPDLAVELVQDAAALDDRALRGQPRQRAVGAGRDVAAVLVAERARRGRPRSASSAARCRRSGSRPPGPPTPPRTPASGRARRAGRRRRRRPRRRRRRARARRRRRAAPSRLRLGDRAAAADRSRPAAGQHVAARLLGVLERLRRRDPCPRPSGSGRRRPRTAGRGSRSRGRACTSRSRAAGRPSRGPSSRSGRPSFRTAAGGGTPRRPPRAPSRRGGPRRCRRWAGPRRRWPGRGTRRCPGPPPGVPSPAIAIWTSTPCSFMHASKSAMATSGSIDSLGAADASADAAGRREADRPRSRTGPALQAATNAASARSAVRASSADARRRRPVAAVMDGTSFEGGAGLPAGVRPLSPPRVKGGSSALSETFDVRQVDRADAPAAGRGRPSPRRPRRAAARRRAASRRARHDGRGRARARRRAGHRRDRARRRAARPVRPRGRPAAPGPRLARCRS